MSFFSFRFFTQKEVEKVIPKFGVMIMECGTCNIITVKFRKISPSMYKPPRGLVLGKLPSNYKVKQSKNNKFFSNYKASPIDFKMQISRRR